MTIFCLSIGPVNLFDIAPYSVLGQRAGYLPSLSRRRYRN